MENQEVYNIGDGTQEVTITHKNGLNDKPPVSIGIIGNIDAVHLWLAKRYAANNDPIFENEGSKTVRADEAHVLIDRDKMSIVLVINETDPYFKGSISGLLKPHPDFTKWQINQPGEDWDNEILAEFIKMNRSAFTSIESAMKLSTGLKTLKVNVEKEIERQNDNKGNYKSIAIQKVKEMSIADKFELVVPIFKGQGKVHMEVEIYINPHNYRISLISPEANDAVHDVRDTIIDEQKQLIQEIAPELVIIEQ